MPANPEGFDDPDGSTGFRRVSSVRSPEFFSAAVFGSDRNASATTFYGGHKAVARPDPIPNSAVKHRIADGSACIACARVGSRQTFKSRTQQESGFFITRASLDTGLQHRAPESDRDSDGPRLLAWRMPTW